ncbi:MULTISPECIES: Trm112 family protein [Marinobacter]|uniref:Trm112 family protein n=1 Tax=Marinobacter TaxID=2742 RepID=UPI001D066027|nr:MULTISPECIES: Trm112 family protein [Marinobacter]MCG8518794.1 Trm112 family protein [Pseudomonadales bacterium]MCK7565963.1 Trm112 family protein [Marinobacter xestospongiae]UDL06880.1 Trm112 family protein [Marinobacter sp. CA1]
MDKKLLAMLACPVCKGDLKLDSDKQELICYNDAMAFPIREGIPVMLAVEARTLTTDERLHKA